ncbi:MAG: NTP transferase domain-containing protein [Proteobacteria bacterium]|nr:NTP transferase domain-containing protein [Pseudomonadota bacterium]MDA1299371.1 NTP transferase domain-containing protein [Pseudomonadota bacterium]
MQIVIPMSGFGERFRRAGYDVPKPLIEVDGKPIIAHVIDLFPGETDFTFICNADHLAAPEYQMADVLGQYCPTGKVVGIAPHKLGPVHAVQQVMGQIDQDRPVVVNYCDFTCFWDWHHFVSFVAECGCMGAIPAYRGFHPHSLGTTNYAYLRESDGWVSDIQEKQPFTHDRLSEYASSGTYYFANGRVMAQAFDRMIDEGRDVNGEYYVSLAYKPLLTDEMPVAVYPLQHFMQWGTPQDLAEYRGWSDVFRKFMAPDRLPPSSGAVIVPMAGLGQRFVDEGYAEAKPAIPVSGEPMILQAVADLPAADHQVFVVRRDMPGVESVARILASRYPGALVERIDELTEGQACTALLGLDALMSGGSRVEGPVTVGACDNGALYDREALAALMSDEDVDVIVWGVRGHGAAARKPESYGWIDVVNGDVVRSVSVKQPLSEPESDPVIIGTFTFRRGEDLRRCVNRLMQRNGRVNGEFYLDSSINDAIALGLRCRLFEVEHYLCWGTPDELRTFEYWQSCFHKWAGHPYRLDQDVRLAVAGLADLEHRYVAMVPGLPAKAR